MNFDVGAINNFLKRFFFQQVFTTRHLCGQKAFGIKFMNRFIRKAAGLGVASIKALITERYEHKYEYCDVLVAGSGPSGLASAYAAAKNGARVILLKIKLDLEELLLLDEVKYRK